MPWQLFQSFENSSGYYENTPEVKLFVRINHRKGRSGKGETFKDKQPRLGIEAYSVTSVLKESTDVPRVLSSVSHCPQGTRHGRMLSQSGQGPALQPVAATHTHSRWVHIYCSTRLIEEGLEVMTPQSSWLWSGPSLQNSVVATGAVWPAKTYIIIYCLDLHRRSLPTPELD